MNARFKHAFHNTAVLMAELTDAHPTLKARWEELADAVWTMDEPDTHPDPNDSLFAEAPIHMQYMGKLWFAVDRKTGLGHFFADMPTDEGDYFTGVRVAIPDRHPLDTPRQLQAGDCIAVSLVGDFTAVTQVGA